MRGRVSELVDLLSEEHRPISVVVMPDFFMDRLVDLDYSPQDFASRIDAIVDHKGGSLDGIAQRDVQGGNAINVASALLRLGVKVTPIVCTSSMGLERIKFYLAGLDVDFNCIKLLARPSVTTALEFKTPTGKTNVMIRDLGSLADFSPADLTEGDYKAVEEADYACMFNWAGTAKHGTRLAETVFKRAKAKGKCKTFLDTADPLPNADQMPHFMEKVLQSDLVDVLSLNENEAISFASLVSPEIERQRRKIEFNELAMMAAQILAKKLNSRIDLHTTKFSTTVRKEGAVFVPAFKVKPMRATGSGDAWDAGDIFGDAMGLSDELRLTLANACAAAFISNPEGEHSTKQRLIKFLKKTETVSA